jgi:hypothetical protein
MSENDTPDHDEKRRAGPCERRKARLALAALGVGVGRADAGEAGEGGGEATAGIGEKAPT